MDTWLWIVIAVVVALLIIGALVAGWQKKRDRDREKAEILRRDAEQRDPQLRKQEAETRGVEAEAERARAEADQLEAHAQDRREVLGEERENVNERLREADDVDPDKGKKQPGS